MTVIVIEIKQSQLKNILEQVMHSKTDNIEIKINDEADEVIKELFNLVKTRHQNNMKSMKGKKFVFMLIYCIINVIKETPIVVDHIKILVIG